MIKLLLSNPKLQILQILMKYKKILPNQQRMKQKEKIAKFRQNQFKIRIKKEAKTPFIAKNKLKLFKVTCMKSPIMNKKRL